MPTGLSYRFGPFTVDAARRRLYRDGEALTLAPKAVELLLLLIERPLEVVEKDDIMRRLWPDTIVEEANLTQHMFTLRKVLGERAGEGRYIATVPRRGYRFLSDVRTEPHDSRHVVPQATSGAFRFRLELVLPDDAPAARLPVPALALSADGRELVYVARAGGTTALFHRSLDSLRPQRIGGTEGATSPFWSPDGTWIGFAADGWIRRVPKCGGAAQALAEAPALRGASCSESGDIVYSPGPAEGLWIAPADGSGKPRSLTTVDFVHGERTHRWPDCLPGSRTALFTIGSAGIASFDEAAVAAVSLDTGEYRIVLERASNPRVMPAGTFSFLREGMVSVAALNPALTVAQLSPLLDGVSTETTGIAHLASANGTVIYIPGARSEIRNDLCWAPSAIRDPQSAVRVAVLAGTVEEPRLSPGGRHVAAGVRAGTSDIWIVDLERGIASRFTAEHDNFAPVWTPDGERLTYSTNRRGPANIYWKRSDGAGDETTLVVSEHDLVPGSWSADGATLLYTEYHPVTGADIWSVTLPGGAPQQVVRTRFNEYGPVWAPRGRWFAYTSDESGEPQVYLREYPNGARVQVTADGGSEPLWSRDGRQLFYRAGTRLMTVDLALDANAWSISDARVALEHAGEPGTLTGLPNYDVAADLSRFLIVVPREAPPEARVLGVVLST